MNRLSGNKRVQILGMLVEGMSLRAASRLSGSSIDTVTKLMVDVGTACQAYHDKHVRGLTCKRIHKTLRLSPAMAAGVTAPPWELEDLIRITDEYEAAQKALRSN